jgi:lipopolysaccharide export system permease protein
MHLLDRLLIRSYLKAYLFCLISLLSIYIVVDLFTNLDSFSEETKGLRVFLERIVLYYGYRVARYYDQMSEAVVLLAAAFTVALMQRNNELVPLLSAGVSARRAVAPILITAFVTLGIGTANQELVIPRIAKQLMNDRDDFKGEKPVLVQGAYEPNGIHIEGEVGTRTHGLIVRKFYVVIPESLAGALVTLSAKEARYFPPGENGRQRGGWLMTETTPAEPPELKDWNQPEILEMIDPGKFFLYADEVDFDTVTRTRNWYAFASTARLKDELGKTDSVRLASMAVLFHTRFTRPILGCILVLMGLSVILRDQNRNVFLSAGLCIVLCGVFFAALFSCKFLGDNEYLTPALAAWLPVILFGPFALVQFDAVHT